MTSNVKIEAHCGDKRDVKITLVNFDGLEDIVKLQDGEVYEVYLYENRSVAVEELNKED